MLTFLFSCRRNDVELVLVEGTITLGGGEWPRPGMLAFTPVQRGTGVPLRPGWANFGKDGRFRATTFKEGDGLVPGTYRVAVEALLSPWEMDKPRPLSCVPAEFESPTASGLVITVLSGSREMAVHWEVPASMANR